MSDIMEAMSATVCRTFDRPVLAVLLTALLAACGDSGDPPSVGLAPGEAPPNVLFVSIDTLRADALGTYGNPRDTSPHIDALAERGVVFEDPTTTTSWTLPSHLSMFTGLSISAHGICDDRIYQGVTRGEIEFPLRGRFLSERLAERGYATAGFHSWKYLEAEYGFGGGFDTYERIGTTVWSDPERKAEFEALYTAGKTKELRAWMEAEPEAFDDHAPTGHLVVDRSLEWLDQHSEQRADDPFFLFVHLFDSHNDYLPPEGFDRFMTDYVGPIDGSGVVGPESKALPGMPAQDLERLEALYHGEVAWVDHQLGRLFDRLEETGLAEDTLVVLTSDHGEEFFEHGHKVHRTHLFHESVHVPLVLSWPGHLPEGRRVEGTVGVVDIVPTLAELLDLPVPERLSGRSLVPAIEGAPLEPAVYLTELMDFSEDDTKPRRLVALREGPAHWLLWVEPDGTKDLRLFDRRHDPLGTTFGIPVTPDSPEWQAFHALLDTVRAQTRSERADAPPRALAEGTDTADNAAELAAMGYLGDTSNAVFVPSDRLCLDGCLLSPGAPTE